MVQGASDHFAMILMRLNLAGPLEHPVPATWCSPDHFHGKLVLYDFLISNRS